MYCVRRKRRVLVSLMLSSFICLGGGCSSVQQRWEESQQGDLPPDSFESVDDVTAKAREYADQGRVDLALNVLRASREKFPDNPQIAELVASYQQSLQELLLTLEQQLLLIETRALTESIPLLEKLTQGHPNRQMTQERLLQSKSRLASHEPELIKCAVEMEQRNIWITRRCAAMAYRISGSTEARALLAAAEQRIAAVEQAAKKKTSQREARKRAARVEQLLTEAELERQQGALESARVKINEALRQDPKNPKVRQEQTKLQQYLDNQVEVLMKLGDSLYRNQLTEAAISVWEIALELDPDQQQLRERLLRAKTIQKNLENIRSAAQPDMR